MRHLAILCCLAIVAGAASAQTIVPNLDQEGRKGDMARMAKEKAAQKFDAMDTDKDGKLSRDEVAKGGASYMAENFEKFDKNKDGFLSWEEYVGHNRWSK